MAILGNRNNLIDDDLFSKEPYTLPAVTKNTEEDTSLKKSIIIASILHPTVVGLIWLIVFVCALLGITFSIFDKPKPKVNDIEFVLVDNLPEKTPLNKHTKFRSVKNTRTGGKRDPKRAISMPSPTPSKKVVQQKSTAGPKAKTPAKQKQVTQKKVTKPQPASKNVFKSLMKQSSTQEARPKPPSARPSLKPASVPRPTMNPTSPFRVPVPKAGTPGRSYSTGPVGGRGTASSGGSRGGGGGASRGHYAPVPSLAPTGGRGGSSGSKLSRGSSGYGNSGNPGGGRGAPGIDSIREPDFGPYMRELQRRIKMNWEPPKGNESKRVVLAFKIGKDGRLLSVRVAKSSGVQSADKAAINAVELTAPFRPLPAEYRHSSVDIQFTFDYNIIEASGYR